MPHFPKREQRLSSESERVNDHRYEGASGFCGSQTRGARPFPDGGHVMTSAQITFIGQYRPSESLLDRARRRRDEALGRRMACIVQTSKDGDGIVEHVFSGLPRLGDLIARTGPDVCIVGVRMEPAVGRKICDMATAMP